MVFTSISFVIFFVVLYILYWIPANKEIYYQNIILLVGSYVFYSWSNWKLTFILFLISIFTYYLGIIIETNKNETVRKIIKYIGVIQGVSTLIFFKYFNFFILTTNNFLATNFNSLNIIVPLGISFFTFRTISYILDIYNEKITANRNIIVYFNYISFFPSILSGPIDKPSNFITQLETIRIFDINNSKSGLRLILWGVFKKLVLANNLAVFTNVIFNNYNSIPPSSLIIGAFTYAIQMYTDFSGYSDIAIGISRLLNINIAQNFNYPFFSQNVAEYWRRWHMSLTNWLTEYVFTPLSIVFRNWGKFGLILSIVINFTICGIWHGANWTYILFGFLHGCYFIPIIISGRMSKRYKFENDNILPQFARMIITFSIVSLTFVIFRSETIYDSFIYYKRCFSLSVFSKPHFPGINILKTMVPIYILTLTFFVFEWFGKSYSNPLDLLQKKFSRKIRWGIYYAIVVLIFYFVGAEQEFIYVQF